MLSEGLAVFQAADFSKSGNLSFASKFESHLFSKQPEPGQEWLINKQDFSFFTDGSIQQKRLSALE